MGDHRSLHALCAHAGHLDIYWRENDGGNTSQVAKRFNAHELLALTNSTILDKTVERLRSIYKGTQHNCFNRPPHFNVVTL